MTAKLREYQREFKRHYKRAMKLKEGGKAWEREMTLCEHYLKLGKAEYDRYWKERY